MAASCAIVSVFLAISFCRQFECHGPLVVSERYWDKHYPLFAVLCLSLVMAGVVLWDALEYTRPGSIDQTYETSEYAAVAELRMASECSHFKGPEQTVCYSRITESEQGRHRSERDLSAQRYMAFWAGLMAFCAFLSVLVSGLGVWFVKRTLDQTAETNRAAVEAAKAAQDANGIMRSEQRPWLSLDFGKLRSFHVHRSDVGSTINVEWTFTVSNFGNSPAKNCQVWSNELDAEEVNLKFHKKMRELIDYGRAHQRDEDRMRRRVIFPSEKPSSWTAASLISGGSNARVFYLFRVVLYDTEAGPLTGVDARVFQMKIIDEHTAEIDDLADYRITE